MADAKVGLVLALDGEKEFSAALKAATEATKLAQASLKQVQEQYKGNANSLEALTEKEKALKAVEQALQNQRAAAQAGLAKSNENLHKIADALEEYEKKTSAAKAALATMTEGTAEYKKQAKAVDELEKAYEKERAAQQREIQSYYSFQKAVTNTDTALTKIGREIGENGKYLDEAKNSADGCATSIDGMGNKVKKTDNALDEYGESVKEASEETKSFGEILEEKLFKQFGKELLVDAAINGIKALGSAMKEAGKFVMNTGMDYEAQMSRVAAISGSTGTDMDKLSKKAKYLGQTTVYSATEAGEAMEKMALAGWKTNDIYSGIDGVLALAASSGMDLGQAAEYVTDNINAFGESASYAGEISDIMATAMSNSSMTTEDLGEAYAKVGASAASYGYSIEDVTAVLMTMANSGKKGSEAGAALNTIMIRLALNTKDCASALEEVVGHDVIYDAQGNMRDLSDVLTDLSTVWGTLSAEERNNLSYAIAGTRQSTALATVMAGLSEQAENSGRSFSQYRDMLQECDGAAKDMSDTMLDNLKGDLQLFNDSLAGFAIALYDNYLSGPARQAVEGITSVINSITDAITPQKTELEQFISDISASNDVVKSTLEEAQSIIDSANDDVTTLEAYKDIILELQGFAENRELTQFEKYQMSNAVEALSDSIPELANNFDAATGKIALTNTELERLFTNAENAALQDAMIAAQSKSLEAWAQAKLDVVKANSAVKKAEEELAKVTAENQLTNGYLEGGYGDLYDEVMKYQGILDSAEQTQAEANATFYEAKGQMDLEAEALAELGSELGLTASATEEMGDAAEGAGSSAVAVAEEITKAYEDMESSLQSSIQSAIGLFKDFDGGSDESLSAIKKHLDTQIKGIKSWKKNMETLGAEAGDSLSQEFYDYLAEMGPEGANLVQRLVDSLNSGTTEIKEVSDAWTEAMALSEDTTAITDATSAGKAYIEAVSAGIEEGADGVSSSAESILQLFTQSITGFSESAQGLGQTIAETFSGGITSGSDSAQTAGEGLSASAKSGVSSKTGGFSEAGAMMAAGVAAGISGGASMAVNAAIALAAATLAAVKAALVIRSPSRKFRDEVGKQISAGVAFGISNNASLASKAATKMSKNVLNAATSWLSKYKKSHTVSLEEEKYYWEQVLKHVKKGTASYKKALSNLTNASLTEAGLSSAQASAAADKIADAFSVSQYKKSGKKKKKKDDETYYSEIYSAAQKYLKNMQTLEDWSEEQELAYWQSVQAGVKSGTQAWYDAQGQIKKLKEDIAKSNEEAAKAALTSRAKNQSTILDYYKTYNKVSLKAEMQYWDQARKQFAAGTEERIDADQNYLKAKEDFYKELEKLDTDYQEDYKKITDKLKDTVEDLRQTYKDAVQSSKESILSSMSLFDEFNPEGKSAEALLYNLQTQVEGLALWEKKLEELKARGISADLYQYLADQGVDGVTNIYALASMTDDQLKKYQQLFDQRSALAESQAVKNNAGLLAETNKSIAEANKEAQESLKDLNTEYSKSIAEISANLPSQLTNLLNQAGSIAEEAVAALFKGFVADTSAAFTAQGATNTISSELGKLVTEAGTIGNNALDGLLKGLQDERKIGLASTQVINSIKRAMEEAAEIHSPSRLFRDGIGEYIALGVGEGMEQGIGSAMQSAQRLMSETFKAAQREMEYRQESMGEEMSGISNYGIAALNDITARYASISPTVSVDNSGMTSLLGTLIGAVAGIASALDGGITLDDGTIIGRYQQAFSQRSADITVRRNRGRL